MISLVAFDLDGTLALSKQLLLDSMGEALPALLSVAQRPQSEKQIASRLPAHGDRSKMWLLPTTGTKLYTYDGGQWGRVYADLFSSGDKDGIFGALDLSLEKTGFKPEKTRDNRIEARASQITLLALGQETPIQEKERWDSNLAKRTVIQKDLMQRLPDMSINMGGATSIDITQKGVDKAYGLKRLRDQSGISLEEMMFIGDAVFPGRSDFPAHQLRLKSVKVKNPDGTLAAIAGIHACLSK
ncbi:HAD-superfamily hydrolase subfamily IIB [Paraphoma chrysanthemicola]|nr:HAD-superfamily hydrolase subfamily IIB [Paraphoma chrysanthemicola]